jgi:hypothetical protein
MYQNRAGRDGGHEGTADTDSESHRFCRDRCARQGKPMRDRSTLHRAVVQMTILGPCRAVHPYDGPNALHPDD